MTVFSVEQSNTVETDLSIEYSEMEDTFEIYLSRNPAINDTSMQSDKDDGSSDEDATSNINEDRISSITHHVNSKDLLIFEMVNDKKWARVYAMIENNPGLASMPFLSSSSVFTADCQDNLLLHHVCKHAAPVEVVECVLNANKQAASLRGNQGCYPLHLACESGMPVDCLLKLLKAYPSAIQRQDERKSRLPLHIAARRGAGCNHEVLTLLMSYFPEAVVIVDDTDKTPVDYVARIKSSKARMESLAILEMGHRWIQVSQNVATRLESNFDDRREFLEKNFENFIDSMQQAHDEEIGRITDKYLGSLLDREELQMEVEDRRERMAKLDEVFQERLVTISRRQDRFKRLEQQTQMQLATIQKQHEYDMIVAHDDLQERKDAERALYAQLDEKDQRIAELEQQLREKDAKHQAAMAMQKAKLEANESAKKAEVEKELAELKDKFELEQKLRKQDVQHQVAMAVQTSDLKSEETPSSGATGKAELELEEAKTKLASMQKDLRLRENLLNRVTKMAKMKEEQAQRRTVELVQLIQDQEKAMNTLIGRLDFFSEQINVLKGRVGEA